MCLTFPVPSTREGEIERLQAELASLRKVALEMGWAIRALDGDMEYVELWTQDGEYIPGVVERVDHAELP